MLRETADLGTGSGGASCIRTLPPAGEAGQTPDTPRRGSQGLHPPSSLVEVGSGASARTREGRFLPPVVAMVRPEEPGHKSWTCPSLSCLAERKGDA